MEVLVTNLIPGMILLDDIYSLNGELILASGTILTPHHINQLNRMSIPEIRIYPSGAEEVMTLPYIAKPAELQRVYTTTVTHFKELFQSLKFGRKIGYEELNDLVEPLIEQVIDDAGIVRQLWQLEICDAYTFDHSVCVSLTSALLAKWLCFSESDIKTAAIAGLMHDIGKVNIPDEILNKPGPLTHGEMEVMKTHSTLGYVLLMNQKQMPQAILTAVLEHHERYDGTGYPKGISGERIQSISRLVSVADVFSAMTTKRVYREACNPFFVAQQMLSESYGYLDPHYTQIFLQRISNYYVGNVVRLNNGQIGEVIMINKDVPSRPLLKVGSDFIDLLRCFDLKITELIY